MYQLTWMKIPLRDWCVQHIRSLHWEVVWMCGCTNMIVSKPYKGVRLNLGYLSIRPQPISQPREHPIEVPGQIQIQLKNYIEIFFSIKSTWVSDICPFALSRYTHWEIIQSECKTNTSTNSNWNMYLYIKTSQELRMLSRSLSDCHLLTLNVMIKVSQFVIWPDIWTDMWQFNCWVFDIP